MYASQLVKKGRMFVLANDVDIFSWKFTVCLNFLYWKWPNFTKISSSKIHSLNTTNKLHIALWIKKQIIFITLASNKSSTVYIISTYTESFFVRDVYSNYLSHNLLPTWTTKTGIKEDYLCKGQSFPLLPNGISSTTKHLSMT